MNSLRSSPMEQRGATKALPVVFVVIAGDRLHYLNHTIHSLSNFIEKIDIVLSQSVHPDSPANLTEQTRALLDFYEPSFKSMTFLQFAFHQGGLATANANHYKALSHAFQLFPSAPDLVCLEDDVLVTPDALELVKRFRIEAGKDPGLSVGFGQAWENKHRWTTHFSRNFWNFLYGLVGTQTHVLNSHQVADDMYFHSFLWQVTRSYWFSKLGPAFELAQNHTPGEFPEPWARCVCWNYDRMMEYLLYGTRILFPEVARAYHIGTGHGMSFHNGTETDLERLTNSDVFRGFVTASKFSLNF